MPSSSNSALSPFSENQSSTSDWGFDSSSVADDKNDEYRGAVGDLDPHRAAIESQSTDSETDGRYGLEKSGPGNGDLFQQQRDSLEMGKVSKCPIKRSIRIIKRLFVTPEKNVSYLSLYTYFALSMFTITLLVFNSANTAYILNVFLKSPKSVQGRQSGDLAFAQEILILIMSLFWGFFSDYFGRPIVFSIGFFNIGVALVLSSWVSSLTLLLCVRLLFATGAAACTSMMTAVLRDYVVKDDRGKAGGMLGFVSGLGAVIAALLFLRFPSIVHSLTRSENEKLNGRIVYLGVGLFATLLAITSLVLLKSTRKNILLSLLEKFGLQSDERIHLQPTEDPEVEVALKGSFRNDTDTDGQSDVVAEVHDDGNARGNESFLAKRMKRIFKHALKGITAVKNPNILLSYCAAFVARSDSIIVTSFMTLWVSHQMHIESPGISDAQAIARGGMISGICQLAALLTAPFWGIAADRLNHPITLTIAAILSSLGYSSMVLLKSVTHGWVFLPITMIGMGEIGVIIVAQGLLARNVSGDVAGAVSGIFSFFGGLGILITTKIGGYLFDTYSPGIMFYIYGVINWVLAVIAFSVVIGQFFQKPNWRS